MITTIIIIFRDLDLYNYINFANNYTNMINNHIYYLNTTILCIIILIIILEI